MRAHACRHATPRAGLRTSCLTRPLATSPFRASVLCWKRRRASATSPHRRTRWPTSPAATALASARPSPAASS
eukprot:4530468-Prymnesium_polylepis.1